MAKLVPYIISNMKSNFIQKGAEIINAPFLWDKTKGKGITVAIIDTGIDIDHPELKDNIAGGYNFTYDYGFNSSNYDDNHGHGTHCAGIIKSVAPEAKFLALKVLMSNGSGQDSWVTQAINYAVNKGADIISMSLSTENDGTLMHEAVKRAVGSGISVVCAAGNSGDERAETDEKEYPGAWEEVIEVSACDNDGKPAWFTNSNDEVDCMAPGVNITSTWMGGGYSTISGTSMATPHVSGSLALLRSLNPNVSEMDLYNKLIECTKDMGYSIRLQGKGIVDLSKYKEDVKLDGLIIMEGIGDLASAFLLQYKFGYPVIEKAFVRPELLTNVKTIIKVGGYDKPTTDTILLSGPDRIKTNEAVLNYINTH